MKKLLIVFIAALILNGAYAQSSDDKKKGKPDIPGTLLIDLGWNVLNNAPDTMATSDFGSKTLNLYYQYDIDLDKKGKFSFHPGIGVGIDKFNFKDDRGVFSILDSITGARETIIDALSNQYTDGDKFTKSKLTMTYLDIPVEFRYYTNPYDKDRSFKVAIGGRIGLLLNTQAKIKYTTAPDANGNNVDRKIKMNQDFDLNQLRYGTTLRVGIGWFNLFYYHNFSELFKTNKGPEDTKATYYTVGLTIGGF